jgi:hypothetical protein
MTVRRDGDVIRLEGDCPVEDAETLAALLEGSIGRAVDLSQCRAAHSAVVQALLRFRSKLQGTPESSFLREVIVPALRADRV